MLSQCLWRRTEYPPPDDLPVEALGWRELVLAGLLCFVELPVDTFVVLVRRVLDVRREVDVRRLVREPLPAAANESAAACASESARNLA